MRLIRIHFDLTPAVGEDIDLSRAASDHLLKVLRLQAGAAIRLFNGDGREFHAELLESAGKSGRARILAIEDLNRESPLQITLAQGIARGERMDLIIQKAVELGVHRLVPLQTERSEVKLRGERLDKRLSHWQGVITSACEQSGRTRLPQLEAVQDLSRWLDGGGASGQKLTLSPEADHSLPQLAGSCDQITLVVGPEGGLGERDLKALDADGFVGARMGPRILRTETAGLAALAVLQSLAGDLK